VNRYQKGKTNLDFTEARDSEWQWNQLGHMQVCTLLQTDNRVSTPPLSFLQAGCPSCHPTNSVKALKVYSTDLYNWILYSLWLCCTSLELALLWWIEKKVGCKAKHALFWVCMQPDETLLAMGIGETMWRIDQPFLGSQLVDQEGWDPICQFSWLISVLWVAFDILGIVCSL